MPWGALRAVMEQVVYGGRIDNEFDQNRLDAFTRSVFTEARFVLLLFCSICEDIFV